MVASSKGKGPLLLQAGVRGISLLYASGDEGARPGGTLTAQQNEWRVRSVGFQGCGLESLVFGVVGFVVVGCAKRARHAHSRSHRL